MRPSLKGAHRSLEKQNVSSDDEEYSEDEVYSSDDEELPHEKEKQTGKENISAAQNSLRDTIESERAQSKQKRSKKRGATKTEAQKQREEERNAAAGFRAMQAAATQRCWKA